MLSQLKSKVSHTARRAGFATGGFLCLSVGLGFLTLAAWMYLSAEFDPQTAALILAGAYGGTGLIFFALASRDPADASPPAPNPARQHPETAGQPPLLQAFLYGLQAGAKADRARH